MIQLYHMIRGANLPGVPGGIHTVPSAMAEELAKVPWLPWINFRHAVQGSGAPGDPYRLNLVDLERKVEQYLFDDNGAQLREPLAYLDIEPPMNPQISPWPGRGEIYRDVLYATAHFLSLQTWAPMQLGIYALLQTRFRRGQPPAAWWHAQIDPFVDHFCLSLYNTVKPVGDDLAGAVANDAVIARKLIDHYQPIRRGRPITAFVWGWSKGGYVVPLDLWRRYVRSIVDQLQDGDAVCWFGNGTPYLDDDFAVKIRYLRKLLES